MAVLPNFYTDLKASDFPLTFPITIQFTDSSTGSPNSWWWNFGDGSSSESQNPSHTYTSEGTFSIKLYAWSSAVISNLSVSIASSDSKSFGVDADWDLILAGFRSLSFTNDPSPNHAFFIARWVPGYRIHARKTTYEIDSSTISSAVFMPLRINYDVSINSPPDQPFSFPKIINPNAISMGNTTIVLDTAFLGNPSASFQVTVSDESNHSIEPSPKPISAWWVGLQVTSISVEAYTSWNGGSITKPLSTNSGVDFIGFPLSGSTPLEVAFDDTSIINIVSWKWDFGDGNTSTIAKPTNTYITNS